MTQYDTHCRSGWSMIAVHWEGSMSCWSGGTRGVVSAGLGHGLQVVRELEKEDLALLVQFFSGTSKVPLEGFKALQVGSRVLI